MRETWLIDGYNILNAMDLRSAASFDHARDQLLDDVVDYAGYTQTRCGLVYDAHHVDHGAGMERPIDGADVTLVYTRADESADAYIERQCALLTARGETVRVVSGDGLIQHIILGLGGLRMPPREFLQTLEQTRLARRKAHAAVATRHDLYGRLDRSTLASLERLRLAREEESPDVL